MNQPNFLFVVTDQHRHDHLGCAGNTLVQTPHIDALSSRGIRFNNFYVASAVCMPNRASMMTGRMPSLHGVRFNGIPLSRDAVTFVDVLRASGYQTALIGKSHLQNFSERPVSLPETKLTGTPPPDALGEARHTHLSGPDYEQERVPNDQRVGYRGLTTPFYGFDHVDLCTMHGDRVMGHYADWLEAHHPDSQSLRGPTNAFPDERYSAPQAWRTKVPESLYSTTYVADRTEAYLEAHAARGDGKPFFIQCSFPDPHHPYTPPGKYWDLYDPRSIPLPDSHRSENLVPTVAAIHDQTRAGLDRNTVRPFAASAPETQEIIALTYGMITNVDDALGRIKAKLTALGLAEDTIIIFTSDHGDFMGDHGIMLKGPLHYQGIAKVPFIWHDPREDSRHGSVTSRLANSLDISATVLAEAGLAPYNGMQGHNILAPGNVSDPDPSNGRTGLLIEQDHQFGNFGFHRPMRVRTYVTDRWRLSRYQGEDYAELYDLEQDPLEMRNLWSEPDYGSVRSELQGAMIDEMIGLQEFSPRPLAYA